MINRNNLIFFHIAIFLHWSFGIFKWHQKYHDIAMILFTVVIIERTLKALEKLSSLSRPWLLLLQYSYLWTTFVVDMSKIHWRKRSKWKSSLVSLIDFSYFKTKYLSLENLQAIISKLIISLTTFEEQRPFLKKTKLRWSKDWY